MQGVVISVRARSLSLTAGLVLLIATAPASGAAAASAPAPAPPEAAAGLASWTPGVEDARRFAAGRPGHVAFLLRDLRRDRSWALDSWRQVPSASLLKTLLMATHLRSAAVRDRPLSAADRGLLGPMIRRSANAPANSLVVQLGQDAIARTGRTLGMGSVRVVEPWGLTRTSPRSQVALISNLERALPARHRGYAMQLLRSVTPSQRWGVMDVDLPAGWKIAAKGGWGSGSGAVDHQTALLTRGEERLALAITTTANGSHAAGKATLRGVAWRLLRELPG